LPIKYRANTPSEAREMLKEIENIGVMDISTLAEELGPRYIFSSFQNIFYERVPHRNSKFKHSSRFISLADLHSKMQPKVAFSKNKK
jgi:hypothetical protein